MEATPAKAAGPSQESRGASQTVREFFAAQKAATTEVGARLAALTRAVTENGGDMTFAAISDAVRGLPPRSPIALLGIALEEHYREFESNEDALATERKATKDAEDATDHARKTGHALRKAADKARTALQTLRDKVDGDPYPLEIADFVERIREAIEDAITTFDADIDDD